MRAKRFLINNISTRVVFSKKSRKNGLKYSVVEVLKLWEKELF